MAYASDVAKSSEELQTMIDKEIVSYKDILAKDGLSGLQTKLHEDKEKWKKTKIKVAVTGELKAGKSSLINSLRGISGDDEEAAPVGVIHTTKNISAYNHPNGNFQFHDLPGIGAVGLTKDEYLSKFDFNNFDFFLIVSNRAFSQYEMDIVKAVKSSNKKFYLVRTCIATTITDDKQAHPKSHDKTTVLQNVRDECMENLKAIGLKDPVIFLIDNYDKENQEYDFKKMEEKMRNDANMLKYEAMVLSLSTLLSGHFQEKLALLRKKIPEKALEIASTGNVVMQVTTFMAEIHFYQREFDIDKKFFAKSSVVFDLEKLERLLDIEPPSGRRSKIFVFQRVVDFFRTMFNTKSGLLYNFAIEGLEKALITVYENAEEIHIGTTAEQMIKQCFPRGYDK